jgi:beta-lactamase class C
LPKVRSLPLKRFAALAALVVLLAAGLLFATGLLRFGGGSGEAQSNQASAPGAPPPLAHVDVPPVVTSGPSAIDYARLDERLTRMARDPGIVGMAVGIIEDGQIRYAKGFGITTTRDGEPVTENTVFRWASLSKGVAADMVATLAARGQLSLTDPINRWSTSLRLPDGGEARLTLADLLAHRLGIAKHAYEPNLESGQDAKMLRGMMATLGNACPPGTCHAYQNVAYDAASEIVERVTGVPYAQALHDNFFAPLGMEHASATRDGLLTSEHWARPHRGGRGTPPGEVSDAYYRVPAAGGVNGSIMDLTLWMRAQMGLAPQVLPPEALTAVQTPRVATPQENSRRARFRERTARTMYGLGWRVMDYAGHTVIGHHGGVFGYRSMIMFDPQLKSGVVVLWNSGSSRPNGIEYEVMDMIYHLPFRDWLGLGGGSGGETRSAVEEEGAEEAAEPAPPPRRSPQRVRPNRR